MKNERDVSSRSASISGLINPAKSAPPMGSSGHVFLTLWASHFYATFSNGSSALPPKGVEPWTVRCAQKRFLAIRFSAQNVGPVRILQNPVRWVEETSVSSVLRLFKQPMTCRLQMQPGEPMSAQMLHSSIKSQIKWGMLQPKARLQPKTHHLPNHPR